MHPRSSRSTEAMDGPRSSTTGWIALGAAGCLLLSSCSAITPTGDESTVYAETDLVEVSTSDDAIGWGDDHTHLVVTTGNVPGAGEGDPADDPADAPPADDEATPAPAPVDEGADGTDESTGERPASADPDPDEEAPVETPAPAPVPAPAGDGATDDAPASDDVDPTPSTTEAPAPTTAPAPDREASLTLITPQGSVELTGPPPGLLPVEPNGDAEVAALAAAAPGSFIAVDVDGEIGPPGARYIRSFTTIEALPTSGDVPTTTPAEDPPLAAAPVDDEVFAELDGTDGDGSGTEAPSSGAIEVQVDGPTDDEIVEQIGTLDGVVEVEVVGPGIIAVTVEDESAAPVTAAIEGVDGVDHVAEDLLAYIYGEPRQGEQWAISNTGDPAQAAGWPGEPDADTNADEAWNVTTGAGVTVAVIDSGQDLGHRDLLANGWRNPGETCGNGIDDDLNGFTDDCQGWDFGGFDNNPSNPPSSNGDHGTHVAGIIAAARNDIGIVGAMPDATLMPLKVARDDGAIPMSAVAAAINYAVDNGAQVINLSLGTKPGTSLGPNSSTELAIRHARANGVVVVAASGNDSANLDQTGPGYPAGFAASYDNVLAVGASTNSDTHAYFSNTGSIVGIHAPGWAILSTLPGNREGVKYGTSMAAPYAAAGAAGVIASGVATEPAAVIARLRSTADQLGWGQRLDIAAAVGYEAPLASDALDVTVTGSDRAEAEVESTLGWTIAASSDTQATGFQLHAAARYGGAIYAVEGLTVQFADDFGELTTAVSDSSGAFPVVPIRDYDSLIGEGTRLTTTMTAPATHYAFVVQLVDEVGAPASAPYVSYVTMREATPPITQPDDAGSGGDGGTGGDGGSGGSGGSTITTTTAPTGGGGGGGGGFTPGTTTTVPSGGGTPTTTSTTTPQPDGTPTTTPGGGGDTPPPAPTTTTTLPDDEPPPSATTTVPDDDTPPPAPTTTAPDDGGGDGGTPTTSTPPTPAQDGPYIAESISPTSGSVDGFTPVTVAGRFPALVPVYVWFGDQPTASVRATVTAEGLIAETPPVETAGLRDVIVKFVTDRPYELRLVDAFRFTEGDDPVTTPTTTPTPDPGDATTTTTTVPGGGDGGPPTTDDPGSSPTTTTTTPGSGDGPPPGDVEPAGPRELGSVTLHPQPTSGPLASLTTGAWPSSGCAADVCTAGRLA